jgi:hypothetical protein
MNNLRKTMPPIAAVLIGLAALAAPAGASASPRTSGSDRFEPNLAPRLIIASEQQSVISNYRYDVHVDVVSFRAIGGQQLVPAPLTDAALD